MNVTRKDATITNTDEDFPGSFEVILSTATKDRDGDELAPEDWKQPLPEHITFDVDHGMSVEKTVGSGVPSIDSEGRLVVTGTYSSLDNAQACRTLVKEGHIRTVSVAFRNEKVTKDGKATSQRELLNGAFVAIPANAEAVVVSAKSAMVDSDHLKAAHDAIVSAGAACANNAALEGKSVTTRLVATKSVEGSYEQREDALRDALRSRYPGDDMWAYGIATFDDRIVYQVSGSSDLRGQWQATYSYEAGTATLGEPERVFIVEQVIPVKEYRDAAMETKALDADAPEDIHEETTPKAADAADADALALQHMKIRALAMAHIS